MKRKPGTLRLGVTLATLATLAACMPFAQADVVTDWNLLANDLIAEARLGTPPAIRVLAIVQTAVNKAVGGADDNVSVGAAVAAANRAALLQLLPAQRASIVAAYEAALAKVEDGAPKDVGIAIGERAASAVLAERADDGADASAAYRPHTSAGAYVPTAMPAIPHWPQRKPWHMSAASQAMDDSMIGVFEAKYRYNFWRPVTAIRNGDIDGNKATRRDPLWSSLIDAPLHPEYPSGHSILAATVGTVLKADIGDAPMPLLATSSPTANGATRQWATVEDFVQEVSDARIFAGIHYRAATRAGESMGRRIGELVTARVLQPGQ